MSMNVLMTSWRYLLLMSNVLFKPSLEAASAPLALCDAPCAGYAPTRYGRARRAHEAGRRAGGGPSGRAVAGDCGDGAYPYEPRRPAWYSARSFRWGRRPGGGAGEDARRRGASERRSERCVRCVISTPDMRFPYRIWPISGPLAVGVPGRYGYRCRDHRAITDIVGHPAWPCPDGGRAPAAARGPRNGRRGAR